MEKGYVLAKYGPHITVSKNPTLVPCERQKSRAWGLDSVKANAKLLKPRCNSFS
jgi:hypothetical protein